MRDANELGGPGGWKLAAMALLLAIVPVVAAGKMKRPRHEIGGTASNNGCTHCCHSPLVSPSSPSSIIRPAQQKMRGPKITTASCLPKSCVALALTTLLLASTVVGIAATATRADDALTEESVVLILGAAGFIGSELAMALHRTYHPRKLLCVDSMASGLGPGGSALSATGNMQTENDWKEGMAGKNKNSLKARTEEELALFEFKRQRAFRVLQTIGDRAHFYRSCSMMASIIPLLVESLVRGTAWVSPTPFASLSNMAEWYGSARWTT